MQDPPIPEEPERFPRFLPLKEIWAEGMKGYLTPATGKEREPILNFCGQFFLIYKKKLKSFLGNDKPKTDDPFTSAKRRIQIGQTPLAPNNYGA